MNAQSVRGKPLTNEEILAIMRGPAHQGFRSGNRKAMSDFDFIQQFRTVVLPGSVEDKFGIVPPSKAAEIYRLRVAYECLPPGPGGFVPQYSPDTVRGQHTSGKLHYLDDQEILDVFGAPFPRTSWIWLVDVLNQPLGRWGYEQREISRTKRKVGRPPNPNKKKATTGKVGRPGAQTGVTVTRRRASAEEAAQAKAKNEAGSTDRAHGKNH